MLRLFRIRFCNLFVLSIYCAAPKILICDPIPRSSEAWVSLRTRRYYLPVNLQWNQLHGSKTHRSRCPPCQTLMLATPHKLEKSKNIKVEGKLWWRIQQQSVSPKMQSKRLGFESQARSKGSSVDSKQSQVSPRRKQGIIKLRTGLQQPDDRVSYREQWLEKFNIW